jgi:hypothetical protein
MIFSKSVTNPASSADAKYCRNVPNKNSRAFVLARKVCVSSLAVSAFSAAASDFSSARIFS